jgi:erythromycin esterase
LFWYDLDIMNKNRWPAVVLALAAGHTTLAQPDDTASFVNWAKEHATPIAGVESRNDTADLKPLEFAIGNARVVALGENSHGVHELLAFRNRLFEFLVQEMRFTAIALETGFSESVPVNDFVLGGTGKSSELPHGVFCWLPGALKETRSLSNGCELTI